MKFSELWLREKVNPKLTSEELCNILTMGGLEVESISPVAENLKGVVVGQVLNVEKHPEADKLKICNVDVAGSTTLSIVCGANNVKPGMKVPVALIDAILPGDLKIKLTKIRNIESEGMLCSAAELGFAEENDGLLELPAESVIGQDLRAYLKLDDNILDVSITPNRGDCLSIKGMAREVAALTGEQLTQNPINAIKPLTDAVIPIDNNAKSGCPRYVGRVIRQVQADAETPTWIKERLRRSGIRSISAVVDVTNYVMLELGQPMHAFDLAKIEKGINVRLSQSGEKITLLDGSEKSLDDRTMVIADQQKALAIAGVMGGMDSGVTLLTTDIFLESAFFTPTVIASQRQFYNLNSDSAYRFERGVDPTLQQDAIEYATKLICDITGGKPGPISEVIEVAFSPQKKVITLSAAKIKQVLGISIPDKTVENIFTALKFDWTKQKNDWLVTVPAYRFDISLAEDLIEEVARLYGYDKIPTHYITGDLIIDHELESKNLFPLRQLLRDFSYHEIISYSFISKNLQARLDPQNYPKELSNPITADMTVMRTNLWPGLINALLYNKSRQQHRVKLFEIGICFIQQGSELQQHQKLAGLMSGLASPEQWGEAARAVDFYDLKGDIQSLLKLFFAESEVEFKQEKHPALHPGQTAAIYHQNRKIGIFGALHPHILQTLDLTDKIFMFELDLSALPSVPALQYQEISKFPEIRRDIAILVKQTVPAKAIQDTIRGSAGGWLKDVFIFDVYQGKGISPGLKSIALGLVIQHPSRTLVDDEVTELMDRVITALKGQLGAELRR